MNRKHYTRIRDGAPVELLRRLPCPIETVERYNAKGEPDPDGKPNRCWTPDAIEKQGRLPEYGFDAFDSRPMLDPGPHDTQQPLTIDDVKMVEGRPTGTHRKLPMATLELRRRLFAHGCDLLRQTDWTQAKDNADADPLKAAAWEAWRHEVRTTTKGLKAGTQDPRTVTWNDPPEPLEDIIE